MYQYACPGCMVMTAAMEGEPAGYCLACEAIGSQCPPSCIACGGRLRGRTLYHECEGCHAFFRPHDLRALIVGRACIESVRKSGGQS